MHSPRRFSSNRAEESPLATVGEEPSLSNEELLEVHALLASVSFTQVVLPFLTNHSRIQPGEILPIFKSKLPEISRGCHVIDMGTSLSYSPSKIVPVSFLMLSDFACRLTLLFVQGIIADFDSTHVFALS